MSIIKLDIKKLSGNIVDLDNQQNISKLKQYIFPVISDNEGWATKDISYQEFCDNPKKHQKVIDATVYDNPHVYIQDNKPVAIFEFEKGSIVDESNLSNYLRKILNGNSEETLKPLNIGTEYIQDINVNAQDIYKFLLSVPIYKSIGIVIKSDLQNKKKGIAEELYKLVSDGIILGSTSNPIVVRQRRKMFPQTYYFPMFGEDFHSRLGLTAIVCAASDLLVSKPNQLIDLKFGAQYSDYYIEERGKEYLKIASEMMEEKKISEYDFKRIKYVISRKKCASIIISFPNSQNF